MGQKVLGPPRRYNPPSPLKFQKSSSRRKYITSEFSSGFIPCSGVDLCISTV